MRADNVTIKNACTHNLKSVSLKIPRYSMVVFSGVSGSGKSSLVFDTIYTEAQRQLIETFSSFARARLPKLSKPDVEEISNISTAIIIDQKRMGSNMRSTVGTATELYTYLKLLYSRCGDRFIGPSFLFGFNHPSGMCPDCKGLGRQIKVDVDLLIDRDLSLREGAVRHPDHKVDGWKWRELMVAGIFDVDKKIRDFSKKEYNDLLYAERIPITKRHGAGIYSKNFEGIVRKLEETYVTKAKDELSAARKDAYTKYFRYLDCASCEGSRINETARSVKVNGRTIPELVEMEFTELDSFLARVDHKLSPPIIRKMRQILSHLIEIGVGYLSLNRGISTLSGGENQRVKMARQLDCDLVDIMYIMDEPSIGLHPRDIGRLIEMLKRLRDRGNSVYVVEHDPAVILSADHIIDVGPEAGSRGGEIVYNGSPEGLRFSGCITGEWLDRRKGKVPKRKSWQTYYEIHDASQNNLKNVSTRIPKGVLTCVTGVAGSGKSSLIIDHFLKLQDGAIIIDQSPVGRSSRSNPATYLGAFKDIRDAFARETGTKAALFSFNSKGACPACKGSGTIVYEMSFMDEVKVVCDECQGRRYTDEVLELKYMGKSIYDILTMTIREVSEFFEQSEIRRKLNVLCETGLGYLELGQSLSTLSGGECQRIKLASELHKKGNIYVMDEPSTGLHMSDIERLMGIIRDLVKRDNTVVVIEHNLDIIREADWIIDMGPEGGSRGGEVIFEGLPEDLVKCSESHTGKFLKEELKQAG